MGITVGIDLGTTNSVVSIKKLNVLTLRNAEGEELTPSSVTAVSDDFIVGLHSRHLLKQYPTQTITSIKRLMGRDFEEVEVQNIIKDQRTTYEITTDATEPGSIRIPLAEKLHSPESISSLILRKLIRDSEVELQGKIDQVVVTVPAYFSDRQKFATRAACEYANIQLLRLLPEPTAAALSFGMSELDKDAFNTLMVFDLGGGTFDISILSLAGGSFMEITKGGDMWLGGNDIDKLLVDYILAEAQKTANSKPIMELVDQLPAAEKIRFLVEIKEKAELAKINLSTDTSTTVDMFGLLKDENGNYIDIDVTITREAFAKLLEPLLQRVSEITKHILHEIRFEPELIDTVLMVGGSSLIPAIQDELKKIFGEDKVLIHPRPMLAIAEGAAIMAAKIAGQEKDTPFAIMHSTAHDYYLQLADGKKHLLVARNTPLPAMVEEKLSFSHAEQRLARLRVFNDVDGVLDTVGELWFHKESDNKDTQHLMLQFSVDEDNIITMKASSLQNEQRTVESQIARGGLVIKLYNDLERTLSSIIQKSTTMNIEHDALLLSKSIVSTILSTSNPTTGETRIDQKQKAEQQIMTLKALQQKNISPISIYEFAQIAEKASAAVLSDAEKQQFKKLITELKQAIESLDDIAHIEQLKNDLYRFYDDTPIVSDMATAEEAAMAVENSYSTDAKKIRAQAKKLADLYIKNNTAPTLDAEKAMLHILIHSTVSWDDTPNRRFDRDVRL